MKKLTLVLCVVLAVVVATSLQAKGRGSDRSDEMNQKIEMMRTQLKAGGHNFEIGWNEAMNYPLDQLCGLNEGLADPEDVQYELNEVDMQNDIAMPSDYTGKCGNVRNQGACGSCWAFAVIGAIEAEWAQKLGVYYDFSEQFLMDCNPYGYGCSGGWFDAFNQCTCPKYFTWESCYPYGVPVGDCDAPGECNAGCLTSWAYVGNSSSVASTYAIKRKIYDHGAVAAAVYVGSYFQAYTGGCFSYNGTGSVNHAVILCGWNDNTPCGTGGWYLKNSWGTGWGINGFMWIKYGVSKVGYAACYAVR